MTGPTMFFWIVAAILTAYGLIKWWERAIARAAEAAKEAEETRKWEADRAKQEREVHQLDGVTQGRGTERPPAQSHSRGC